MIKRTVLWLAVILLSLRIFGFSSDTGPESDSMSQKITKVVVNVVEKSIPTSAQSESDSEKLFELFHFIVRKTAHFSIYALLAVLTLLLARSYELKMRVSALISASYCLLFAVSDEIHQLFVSGRSGQISDVFIDFCGTLCGIGFVSLICFLWNRRKKSVKDGTE